MQYGLIGKRLIHSFSAEIHKKLCGYDYELKELGEEDLELFLKEKQFKGINVTIPYKTSVIEYLDCIDDAVRAIGAVNTIVNRGGNLYGYNTDAYGLTALINRNKIEIKDKKVLILGSGGTSKTAEYVANLLGAKSVLKVSRTKSEKCISYIDAVQSHTDTNIIINTTPCGMYPKAGSSPIDISFFGNLEAVVDVIYNPLKTKLISDAESRNITAAGGLYMLVYQAAKSAELFTDSTIDIKKIDGVYSNILKSKQSIVLVGMPSCGKSTVGKALSEELNMPFFDSDSVIYEKTGKTPAYIIKSNGEAEFRKIESEVISELSAYNHIVLATGGGAVTVNGNISALKSNGRIYFIDRPCELLEVTADRPLSSSASDISALYKKRIELYKGCADAIIKNNSDIGSVINCIKEDFCYENIDN